MIEVANAHPRPPMNTQNMNKRKNLSVQLRLSFLNLKVTLQLRHVRFSGTLTVLQSGHINIGIFFSFKKFINCGGAGRLILLPPHGTVEKHGQINDYFQLIDFSYRLEEDLYDKILTPDVPEM